MFVNFSINPACDAISISPTQSAIAPAIVIHSVTADSAYSRQALETASMFPVNSA